jgi:hypothetical protein
LACQHAGGRSQPARPTRHDVACRHAAACAAHPHLISARPKTRMAPLLRVGGSSRWTPPVATASFLQCWRRGSQLLASAQQRLPESRGIVPQRLQSRPSCPCARRRPPTVFDAPAHQPRARTASGGGWCGRSATSTAARVSPTGRATHRRITHADLQPHEGPGQGQVSPVVPQPQWEQPGTARCGPDGGGHHHRRDVAVGEMGAAHQSGAQRDHRVPADG